jgi:AcrR family transcriptional regulator
LYGWIEPNRKKFQGAKTRADLLAAGLQVFAERGYHGSTMEDIAAAAGTTRGALYWHFADKEDFLVALLEGIIKRRNKQTIDAETFKGSAARLLASSFFFYAQSNQRLPWWNRLIILVGLDADNISPKVQQLLRRAMEPNRYFLPRYIWYGQ